MFDDRLQYLLARRDLAPGGPHTGEYWYRPGELLVHERDYDLVSRELRRWEARPWDASDDKRYDEIDERCEPRVERLTEPGRLTEVAARLGILRFRLPPRMDVPAVVERLRQTGDGPEPRVAPHHIFMGEQWYRGGPGGPPSPARPPDPEAADTNDRPATVAVLDTGLTREPRPAGDFHLDDPRDIEVLDLDSDGTLDDQAGHGTFVAGIVLREAPAAQVRVARVLDSFGVADELTIVDGMLRCKGVDVMNMSLGGYAHGNVPPLAIEAVLEQLDQQTVIVAAAGNHGRRRPMWPAAFKRVIAVGAYTQSSNGQERADFSNHGSWVDACAPGVDVVSNFVEHDGPLFAVPDPDEFSGWAAWSGTSFAAPMVAGRIAGVGGAGGAPEAAFRLIHAPGLDRMPELGTVIR